MQNIVGQKFGKLMVLEKTKEKYFDGSLLYVCKCECGNTIKTTSSRLKSGHVTSCGCAKHEVDDITGNRYGRLVVLEFSHTANRESYWKCKCDCGNTCTCKSKALKEGGVVSCGCKNKENKANLYKTDKGFVEGTSLSAISPSRKLNKNNKTGVRGVSFHAQKQKYRVQITFKGKCKLVGMYDNLEDAKQARLKAEDEYFGEYLEKYGKQDD